VLTKRTSIGIGVGSVIIAIGVFALVNSFGIQAIDVDETFQRGEDTSYQIRGPEGSEQSMRVSSDKFTEATTFEWTQPTDERTNVEVKNLGSSEMTITGTFRVTTDPILFAYHIIVITAGVVIIGFSLGFSIRKPRGF